MVHLVSHKLESPAIFLLRERGELVAHGGPPDNSSRITRPGVLPRYLGFRAISSHGMRSRGVRPARVPEVPHRWADRGRAGKGKRAMRVVQFRSAILTIVLRRSNG
ncbi:hypothetical protein Ga0080559_TMP3720 [Salipiger profundus]|uniref:Uncharacterized protein n=1 Tax=Salipiger profundus TaxID=1229727 RepID=A0A1U7D8X4_9RHOB|nr:hypothetical protein Ga0080559_TMP3720 [Salipiger profundus]